jgi:hypothetical protein
VQAAARARVTAACDGGGVSETGEPPELHVSPSSETWLRALFDAQAAGDDAAVQAVLDASTAEDRDAFRAWARHRYWQESEVMATQEALAKTEARGAALEAAIDQDDAALAEAERCGCSLYADGPADEHVMGTVRVVHHCGR